MFPASRQRSSSPRTPQFPVNVLPQSPGKKLRVQQCSCSRSPQPPPQSHHSRQTLYSQISPVHRSRYRLYQLKNEYSEIMEVVRERERKQVLARLLKDHLGVALPRTKVELCSKEELVREAIGKWRTRIAKNAARRMVDWLYRTRVARVQRELKAREHLSAFRIQQHWKRHKREVLIPRANLLRRHCAATTIQRVFRGYRVRVSTVKLKVNRDIEKLSMHYRLIRNQMLRKSATKIYRVWKKWKVTTTQARKAAVLKALPPRTEPLLEPQTSFPDGPPLVLYKAQSVTLEDLMESPVRRSRARTVQHPSFFAREKPHFSPSDLPPIPQERE